ncbi:DUF748 domain-containing protein [Ferruginibacter albus]|uniref:DUF748 domain-containing protein n=1 Tax=Ferruginibacter albus TaxID=2875540 RepID=UPI001CC59142|nr:DUF748 domain-containing protein [Ferruginibacter albus]UAY53072.1 DUF748 domain-containing protein [Ferruginibacter albus]
MPGYYGHIQDIDVSLYRGAYQIQGMYLNKLDSSTQKQTPFFTVNDLDISIQWKALFHGRLVGKLIFNTPKLIFTKDRAELNDVKKDTNSFQKVLKDFMPLKINRFEINNGSIHYVDAGASPKVDISLQQLHVLAENLTNVENGKVELPSTLAATANVYGGTLALNMKMDFLSEKTRFDLNADVKNVNLALLNDFLKAYGGFDVNKGSLGLYTEFAAKDGKYVGYVKPVIKDLKVLGPQDRHDNILQKAWEVIVGAAAGILKNHKEQQIATKVSIEGAFGKSSTNVVDAIWELLRNAFIQALMPSIDNQINLSSVNNAEPEHKTFFQKLFGKKDDKKKK